MPPRWTLDARLERFALCVRALDRDFFIASPVKRPRPEGRGKLQGRICPSRQDYNDQKTLRKSMFYCIFEAFTHRERARYMIGPRAQAIGYPRADDWKPIDTAPKTRRIWLQIKGYLAIGQWRQRQLHPALEVGGYWHTDNDALNRWLDDRWPQPHEIQWQELSPPPKRRAKKPKAKRPEAIATDPGT